MCNKIRRVNSGSYLKACRQTVKVTIITGQIVQMMDILNDFIVWFKSLRFLNTGP